MGLFNYIDTFFFISLGITFILILLLVFHFKQQIISLEHKNDTMFEIINNIVKELTALKTAFIQSSLSRENEIINTSVQCVPPKINVENKIVISDSDDDTSYTSGQSETDSDAETDDDDSDSDYESDDDVDRKEIMIEKIDIHEPREESSNEIKVINIELNNIVDSMDNDSDIEEETDNLEEENHIEDFVNTETIVVEKVDPSENLGTTESTETLSTNENNKEVYRKMTLQALKTLVITKGLSSDTSKMKKNDLLKLLESEI
jgi:hypothetical protein